MCESIQNPQCKRGRTGKWTFFQVLPVRTSLLLFITFLAIILPFCLFGNLINAWTDGLIKQAGSHRLLTGGLLTLLLSVDIVMPIPSSLVSTACGMILGFTRGTLTSFIGMSLSAAAGYLMGRTASPAVERMIGQNELALLRDFQHRHGAWMLLALRPVPVLAEASILFSGLTRQPLPNVLSAMVVGNLAVSMVYAAVGTWGRVSDSFLPAFGASLVLSGVLLLWLRRKRLNEVAFPGPK
jgi:uncharacterized membrane protein YdjX (TVP38/TMEM64 family)